mmetsp:Transcript_4571/g.6675  ORF Transcript_4571/g.6675 Transcript_4571/m.6675 type:complete len:383 (+) Transcript_4571:76-1224(+)
MNESIETSFDASPNAGLALSLDDMIKARRAEKKESSKKTKRTPIKSSQNISNNKPTSAQKSLGSSKAKRKASMAAKRGLKSDEKPSRGQVEREVYRQQRGGRSNNTASRGCRVYVGNLSYDTSWKDLKDFVNREIGDVKHADVMKDNGRSKGYGIVEFGSARSAREACDKLHGAELQGRPLNVREDREESSGSTNKNSNQSDGKRSTAGNPSLSVYVGNLPYDISWQDLKDFMRQAGNVDNANIATFPDGKSRGFGVVTYQNPKEAQRACDELDNSLFRGRPIYVKADEKPRNDGGKPSTSSGLSVYVGNLPFDLKWQDLKDHARRAGNVDNVKILENPDGRSKGSGVVKYQHPKDAQRAIRELQGSMLGGRPITLREFHEA